MTSPFLAQHAQFGSFSYKRMTVMEAVDMLDGLVDESDPDVDFPNSFHAFQTAEGIRKAHPNKGVLPTCPDGCWGRRGGLALSQYALHPPTAPELCLCPSSCTPLACPVPPSPSDWFHLVGLLHDLGKVLALAGEPQVRRWVEGGQQGRARGSLRSRLWTEENLQSLRAQPSEVFFHHDIHTLLPFHEKSGNPGSSLPPTLGCSHPGRVDMSLSGACCLSH